VVAVEPLKKSVKHVELTRFASDSELAHAVAAKWLEEIETAGRSGTPHCAALSGGRIAGKLFSTMAELVGGVGRRLSPVQFFWADERCVPPTDPESNFRTARELLFTPLQVADAQIHRIQGEAPPTSAVTKAEAEICRIAPLNCDGQPVLDLILLGMGEDGHVASLFPREPESVAASNSVYRRVTAPKSPPQRITLGYMAIAAARQVWVLVSGPGKEAALRESLMAAGQTPLASVLKSRSQTRVFTASRAA